MKNLIIKLLEFAPNAISIAKQLMAKQKGQKSAALVTGVIVLLTMIAMQFFEPEHIDKSLDVAEQLIDISTQLSDDANGTE